MCSVEAAAADLPEGQGRVEPHIHPARRIPSKVDGLGADPDAIFSVFAFQYLFLRKESMASVLGVSELAALRFAHSKLAAAHLPRRPGSSCPPVWENTRRSVQYNPAAPCIASTTRLLVKHTSFVRNLPRGALDVDRWLARERKEKGGGCGILE